MYYTGVGEDIRDILFTLHDFKTWNGGLKKPIQFLHMHDCMLLKQIILIVNKSMYTLGDRY